MKTKEMASARMSAPGGMPAKATSFQKAMARRRLMGAVSKAPKMPMTVKPLKSKGMKKKTDGMDDM